MLSKQPTAFLLFLIMTILLLASLGVYAQEVPKLPLVVRVKIPVPAGLVKYMAATPPACDAAGNLYMQIAEPAPANPGQEPVTRISADGKQLTRFSLNSIPGMSVKSNIDNFAVTPRGEVFLLVYIGDSPQLVSYHDDGQFDSAHLIDRGIFSTHFAVFPTGEFLVRGIERSGPPGKKRDEALTGLFDRNGRFLKEVALADELPFKSRAEYEEQADYRKQHRAAWEAMWHSQTLAADDGNVYVVRPANPLSVDVISPAGEIIRRLKLKPPGPSFQAGSLKVAGGNIVVEYFQKIAGDPQNRISDFTYSVFAAESGEKLYDYYWPAEPSNFFACYTPNYFTFLNIEDDGLKIVHAAAR